MDFVDTYNGYYLVGDKGKGFIMGKIETLEVVVVFNRYGEMLQHAIKTQADIDAYNYLSMHFVDVADLSRPDLGWWA